MPLGPAAPASGVPSPRHGGVRSYHAAFPRRQISLVPDWQLQPLGWPAAHVLGAPTPENRHPRSQPRLPTPIDAVRRRRDGRSSWRAEHRPGRAIGPATTCDRIRGSPCESTPQHPSHFVCHGPIVPGDPLTRVSSGCFGALAGSKCRGARRRLSGGGGLRPATAGTHSAGAQEAEIGDLFTRGTPVRGHDVRMSSEKTNRRRSHPMTEHQCARTLIESDIEIATAIRAVPLSVPHARATQLLMYACRHRRT